MSSIARSTAQFYITPASLYVDATGATYGYAVTQDVNVGDTSTYYLVAYAYTDGSAVTTADLDLWYNGLEVTTTFAATYKTGWYRLTGTFTGIASSIGAGVRVHANKTVYIDEISIQSALASDTTLKIINTGTGKVNLELEGNIIPSTNGMKIGTATTQKLGFYNATPVVQPSEITDELTTIAHTAPGTPDYAIQNLTSTSPFGFVTQDEGNTVLSVIANLQARVNALETVLVSLGLLADAD